MAAKNAAKPRPGKNADGQAKQPSYNHSISIEPGEKPEAPPPPGAPAPGATNPLTHPNHPMMQSSLGAGGPQKTSAVYPVQDSNPSKNPLGNITPSPSQDTRQVRENIQFKDMNPVEQAQTAQQQGLDPYAPLKMVQQGVEGALQGGPSTGPVPNMLAGPYVPPGVEAFPDDFAHLSTLMQQGMAPGSSPQEHELGLNSHSLVRAKLDAAMSQAQNGAGAPAAAPPAAPPTGPPPTYGPVGFAPGIPEQAQSQAPPPPMSSSMGAPSGPPMQPGAPGGVPPALIAMLLAKHKANRPTR